VKEKDTDARSAERIALYDKLIATSRSIERKGDTKPYTSHNGPMFSLLTKEGPLALRLSKDKIEEFLKKYQTTQPIQYGVVMKEYVLVPDTLLKKTAELKLYFAESFKYVSSLKPKPTTRPKKK
jgi:hypothetical protein